MAIAESGTPVSDSGPIFEAQIGTQFSALGSHCRIPAFGLKKQRRLRGHRPLSPPGAYRFAPDPISKKKKGKNSKIRFLELLCFPFLLDCLDTSRIE